MKRTNLDGVETQVNIQQPGLTVVTSAPSATDLINSILEQDTLFQGK